MHAHFHVQIQNLDESRDAHKYPVFARFFCLFAHHYILRLRSTYVLRTYYEIDFYPWAGYLLKVGPTGRGNGTALPLYLLSIPSIPLISK